MPFRGCITGLVFTLRCSHAVVTHKITCDLINFLMGSFCLLSLGVGWGLWGEDQEWKQDHLKGYCDN